MSTKHTPGPWVVRHDFRCSDGTTTVGVAASTIAGGSAAVAWPCGVDSEQEQANARLIASAPAMLAELQNIASADPRQWDEETRDQFQQWAQNRARSVINKATGGAP